MKAELDRLLAALAEQRRLIDENRRLRAEVLEQVRLARIAAEHIRGVVRRIPVMVVILRLPGISLN